METSWQVLDVLCVVGDINTEARRHDKSLMFCGVGHVMFRGRYIYGLT